MGVQFVEHADLICDRFKCKSLVEAEGSSDMYGSQVVLPEGWTLVHFRARGTPSYGTAYAWVGCEHPDPTGSLLCPECAQEAGIVATGELDVVATARVNAAFDTPRVYAAEATL